MAAKILRYAGDVWQLPSTEHIASYTGPAPMDASSDPRQRHRLNERSNEQPKERDRSGEYISLHKSYAHVDGGEKDPWTGTD